MPEPNDCGDPEDPDEPPPDYSDLEYEDEGYGNPVEFTCYVDGFERPCDQAFNSIDPADVVTTREREFPVPSETGPQAVWQQEYGVVSLGDVANDIDPNGSPYQVVAQVNVGIVDEGYSVWAGMDWDPQSQTRDTRNHGPIDASTLGIARRAVEKGYKPCLEFIFDDGNNTHGTRHLPGPEAATLSLAAGMLDASISARVAGIFSQESDFQLDPSKWGSDTGPAQLTGAVLKHWPWAVVGNAFGDRLVTKKTGRDRGKPAIDNRRAFDGSSFSSNVLDNMATMRNIVMSYRSDYDAASAYGPGPNRERDRYATEVDFRTPAYHGLFKCILAFR